MRFHSCALAGLLTLAACSGEDTGSTGSTSASNGGEGGAGAGGSVTASGGDTGSSSGGTSTGGTGGAATGGSGGGAPGDGACPTGQFPAEKQVVFEASGGDSITSDTTWTKDKLYIIKTEIAVSAALTIEAGTTVCFDSSFADEGSLLVSPYGTGALDVQGTSAEHVTFTAVDSGKGWAGIAGGGGAEKLSIAFADFYYASRSGDADNDHFSYGAVRIEDGSSDDAPPARLHHVTFSGLKRGGAVWLRSDAGLTADSIIEVKSFNLSQSELQYVDSVVLVSLNAAQSLAPGMISIAPEIPESKAGVELLRKSMHGSCSLPAIDVPYLAPSGVFVSDSESGNEVTLTMEAGVAIRMGQASSVHVGGRSVLDANLIIDGTADKPVVLSFYPFPGSFSSSTSWEAIVFNRSDPGISRVSHAILQNAGEGVIDVETACNESRTGAILINAPSLSDYVGLPIDHTTIDGSASNGIVAECGFYCIEAATDYQDPALGNTFVNITGAPQILATCP